MQEWKKQLHLFKGFFSVFLFVFYRDCILIFQHFLLFHVLLIQLLVALIDHTCHFSRVHRCFGAKALFLFYLSFPVLDTLPTCHFCFDLGPLAVSLTVSTAPSATLSNVDLHLICHAMYTFPIIVLEHQLASCNQIFPGLNTSFCTVLMGYQQPGLP